jgi:bifunctional non-homologous end joining protein LigD
MARAALTIPRDRDNAILDVDGREVRLTNLRKVFWAGLGLTKGDLLRYYAEMADVLLPHVRDRAMVMKRYPHGASGEFFFMKRAPSPRPDWIRTCAIDHGEEKTIDFPVIDDRASLMWVINLGCIDLNQWYARCDEVGCPDYVHFDLIRARRVLRRGARRRIDRPRGARHVEDAVARQDDRVQGHARLCADCARTGSERRVDVRQGARPGARLAQSGAPHRGVSRREAPEGTRARRLQPECLGTHPGLDLFRPPAAGGDGLHACHLEGSGAGRRIEDFTMLNVPARVKKVGDLWKPLNASAKRVDLGRYV